MKRNNRNAKTRRILYATIPLLLASFTGCTSLERAQNYEGIKGPEDVAILQHRGFRFWVYGDEKKPVDELWLTPGEYMIGFVGSSRSTAGAARCDLKKGRYYSFEVTSRQYLPKSGVYAFKGRCFFDPQRKENLPPVDPAAKKETSSPPWYRSLIFWRRG